MTAILRRRRSGAQSSSQTHNDAAAAAATTDSPATAIDSDGEAAGIEPGRRSRRRWLIPVIAIAVLAILLGVVASPIISVRTLEISGEVAATRAELLAAAGIKEGDPLLRTDIRRARNRLRAMPAVASAKVEKIWPDTVRIVVTPERPLVGFVGPEQAVMVSANGRVIASFKNAGGLPKILPRVVAKRLARMQPGDAVPSQLMDIAEIHAEAPLELLPDLFEGTMGPNGSLSFRSPNGGQILFGNAEDVPAKLLAATTVLGGRVVRDCLATLDLRDPSRPTVSRTPGCAVAAPTTGTTSSANGAARPGTQAPGGKLVCTRVGCKVIAPDGSEVLNPAGATSGSATSGGRTSSGAAGSTGTSGTSGTAGGTNSPSTTAPGRLVCDRAGCKVVSAANSNGTRSGSTGTG